MHTHMHIYTHIHIHYTPRLGASPELVLAADDHVHGLGQHPAWPQVVQPGRHPWQSRLLLAVDQAEGESHLWVGWCTTFTKKERNKLFY